MTNEQIQALQAAADATQATEWEFHERYSLSHAGGGYVSINGVEAIWCLNKAVGGMAHSKDVLRYIAAANPAVILSLLAERDADKALIAELDQRVLDYAGIATARAQHVFNLEKRIAELEARTLTVKLPDDGFEDCIELWGDKARDTFDCGYNFSAQRHEEAPVSACAAADIKLDVGGDN